MINVITSSRYKINRKAIKKLAAEILQNNSFDLNSDLNIIFAGKIKLREISKKYKQEDVALPVLTFVYNEKTEDNGQYLGEVLICYPQAVLMAAQKNKTVNEIIERLVKHGIDNIIKNV